MREREASKPVERSTPLGGGEGVRPWEIELASEWKARRNGAVPNEGAALENYATAESWPKQERVIARHGASVEPGRTFPPYLR